MSFNLPDDDNNDDKVPPITFHEMSLGDFIALLFIMVLVIAFLCNGPIVLILERSITCYFLTISILIPNIIGIYTIHISKTKL